MWYAQSPTTGHTTAAAFNLNISNMNIVAVRTCKMRAALVPPLTPVPGIYVEWALGKYL